METLIKKTRKSPYFYLLGKSAWQDSGFRILDSSPDKKELLKEEESNESTSTSYILKVMSESACIKMFGKNQFDLMQDELMWHN